MSRKKSSNILRRFIPSRGNNRKERLESSSANNNILNFRSNVYIYIACTMLEELHFTQTGLK